MCFRIFTVLPLTFISTVHLELIFVSFLFPVCIFHFISTIFFSLLHCSVLHPLKKSSVSIYAWISFWAFFSFLLFCLFIPAWISLWSKLSYLILLPLLCKCGVLTSGPSRKSPYLVFFKSVLSVFDLCMFIHILESICQALWKSCCNFVWIYIEPVNQFEENGHLVKSFSLWMWHSYPFIWVFFQ